MDQEAIVHARTSELHEANISLRKEVLERERAEQRAHQESLAKSIFLAKMSHEIVRLSIQMEWRDFIFLMATISFF